MLGKHITRHAGLALGTALITAMFAVSAVHANGDWLQQRAATDRSSAPQSQIAEPDRTQGAKGRAGEPKTGPEGKTGSTFSSFRERRAQHELTGGGGGQ